MTKLFQSALDERMDADIDRIIEQLEIKDGQTVLEIGCGWGGFAKRLMETTGAKWTGTTISQQQYNYAKKIIDKGNWEIGRAHV